jgi:murein L,D-transpeptidase YafK
MILRFCFLGLLSVLSIGLSGCEADKPQRVVVSQQATSILIPPAVTTNAEANAAVDYIVVQKADHVMSLWKQGRIIKTYPILAFGADPLGHKMREGDEKTPEGTYFINDKHPSQHFQKFLNISYPNDEDRARAQKMGVPVGGNVGIHGDRGGISGFFQRMDKNWTDGCIAMRNADIEEIFAKVEVGTPIMIKP